MLFDTLTLLGRPWIAFDNDGGQGGAGNPDPDPGDPPTVPAGIQGIIDRNAGDAIAAINQLMAENARLRQQRSELRQRIPAEGAVILTGDQIETWNAAQEAGITPATLTELRQAAEERDQLRAERDRLAREGALRDAAAVTGYKPAVLATLIGDLGVEVETEGDARQAVIIDGDNRIPLADYAAANWADFLPALTAAAPTNNGITYPPQGSGSAPRPQSAARATLNKLYGGSNNG